MYTNGTEVRVGEDVDVNSGNTLVTYSGLTHDSTSTNCTNNSDDTPDSWSFDTSETDGLAIDAAL